jgi:hypothetical protein
MNRKANTCFELAQLLTAHRHARIVCVLRQEANSTTTAGNQEADEAEKARGAVEAPSVARVYVQAAQQRGRVSHAPS